jgi:hypothetical protein
VSTFRIGQRVRIARRGQYGWEPGLEWLIGMEAVIVGPLKFYPWMLDGGHEIELVGQRVVASPHILEPLAGPGALFDTEASEKTLEAA